MRQPSGSVVRRRGHADRRASGQLSAGVFTHGAHQRSAPVEQELIDMRRLATLRKNEPPMKRLLIVSNRLPVTVSVDRDKLSYHPSSGGLASGIGSYLEAVAQRGQEAVWIGWPGTEVPAEREDEVREVLAREHGAQPVFIDAETMFSFYEGFCNDTLWPLFHYFPSIAAFKDRYWDCLLYTSDAADERSSVDLGGRRIIK